ncbi:acyl carrier protein-like protein [Amanita rubescens]|nr:acyl carrier protein-like protein [Amanita rubescens]
MSFLRFAARAAFIPRASWINPRVSYQLRQQALFSSGSSLPRDDIEKRVLNVFKDFDKVDAAKLSPSASFTKDLGLDSLDAVEVVLAVEEEFGIEIPDAEADDITTVQQAIDYIAKTPDAH